MISARVQIGSTYPSKDNNIISKYRNIEDLEEASDNSEVHQYESGKIT